jgi:acetyl esterase/lipase
MVPVEPASGQSDHASPSCKVRIAARAATRDNRGMPDEQRGNVLAFPQAPDAIELRHLRAFVAVAEELNFGRAADRLHLSQSALSRQVGALERLLGCDLLNRSTHRVELTIAGEALLDRARRLLEDVDEAVSATLSIGGELAGRLAELWAPLFAVADDQAGLQAQRDAFEAFHGQFSPPPEVAIAPVNAGGVPSFELAADRGASATILYFHGGGHVMGSAFGHRPLLGALAVAANARVVAPEYRLAPEYPFPADLEDAIRAYRWLLESGTPPGQVVLAGDSSGCGLALAVLLSLKQEQDAPLPGGALLFCPWTDLSGEVLKPLAASDEQITLLMDQVRGYVDAYLGGHPVDEPVLSPLTADLSGLPPMLIQAATGDPQREEAHLLAERARAHGVDTRLELYPGDTHAFQVFWSFLPEAIEGLSQAGRFVQTVVARAEAQNATSRR